MCWISSSIKSFIEGQDVIIQSRSLFQDVAENGKLFNSMIYLNLETSSVEERCWIEEYFDV